MSRWLLVGLGGLLGSMARYGLAGIVQRWVPEARFPWGTLAVNALGCGLIGLLAGLADGRQLMSAETRVFLSVGVLGGFTTFSTFGLETLMLSRGVGVLSALGNVLAHVVLGLLAVWAGYLAVQPR